MLPPLTDAFAERSFSAEGRQVRAGGGNKTGRRLKAHVGASVPVGVMPRPPATAHTTTWKHQPERTSRQAHPVTGLQSQAARGTQILPDLNPAARPHHVSCTLDVPSYVPTVSSYPKEIRLRQEVVSLLERSRNDQEQQQLMQFVV